MKKAPITATVALLACTGCAHLPDATVSYYLAQSKVSFKVIRTVGCDPKDNLVIANAVTPSVSHSADRSAANSIAFDKLKGTFSDSDVKFEFYEDGRIKSINASGTGQGEAILKTALSLTASLAAFEATRTTYPTECKFIKDVGSGKPLTLTYEGDVDLTSTSAQDLKPDMASAFNHAQLARVLGRVCATYLGKEDVPVLFTHKETGSATLLARQPGLAKLKVTAGGITPPCSVDQLWEGKLPVAQLGTVYNFPVQKPPLFGKQVFAASFAESGALASVQYASNTGAGQALNVLNAAVPVLQGETTAQKAAALKAEADLIAQQQRLVQCQANPTTCK